MRVLVADKFETSGLEGLRGLGCDVLFEPDLKESRRDELYSGWKHAVARAIS